MLTVFSRFVPSRAGLEAGGGVCLGERRSLE